MILTTNHKDKEISDKIMQYLYDISEIQGNEEHLKDAEFKHFLGQDEIWKLEKMLSDWFDGEINLPGDLKLIEDMSFRVSKASDIFKTLGETQIEMNKFV
jgi:hypothetical protein